MSIRRRVVALERYARTYGCGHGRLTSEEVARIWMPDNGRGDGVAATVAQQLAEDHRVIIYRADDTNAS